MRKKVGFIFGGKSVEHDVSLQSASTIYKALDKKKLEPILIGVDKKGEWYTNPSYDFDKNAGTITGTFFQRATSVKWSDEVMNTTDLFFPIIHGTFGEDGTLQGVLKSLNKPFVGPDVLGSAICMDKEVTKRLLRDSQIPVADFMVVKKNQEQSISFETVKDKLGIPFFIKPCNSGSSVGVAKVTTESDFKIALTNAFRYDKKILIEEAVTGKEIECGIIGNDIPIASGPGEIVPIKEFYSYEAKYKDKDGAKLQIPAAIDEEIATQIQQTAIRGYQTTCCEGMARVDFFLRPDNTFVLNEINTLPGFTEISMFPKLFEYMGITYTDLITKLIEMALERYEQTID